MIDMQWTLKTAPATEPVTTTEAKLHCRVDADAEDALFTRLIAAARGWVEDYTGRALFTQTWQASLPGFADRIWLPRAAPLGSVTFVKYYDTSNVLQTLSTDVYYTPAFHEPALLERKYAQVWPSTYERSDAVQIEYVAGHASAANIPKPLVQATLLLVGHWYQHREGVISGTISAPIAFAVEALCAPYRVFGRPPECAA